MAGAAEAYTTLLQRAAASEVPELPVNHAERMAAHVGRAAALLRLGRCTAAAADCDAALALLLLPGAGEPALLAGPGLASQAYGRAAAGREAEPSSPRSASGCVESELQSPASMLAAREHAGSGRGAAAAGDATGARAWAHTLAGLARGPLLPAAPRLQTVEDAGLEACIAPGGAAEGDLRVDGDGWAGAAAETWSPGGGKRAMLLCALLRRGSAYAHAKRCAACGSGLRRAVSCLQHPPRIIIKAQRVFARHGITDCPQPLNITLRQGATAICIYWHVWCQGHALHLVTAVTLRASLPSSERLEQIHITEQATDGFKSCLTRAAGMWRPAWTMAHARACTTQLATRLMPVHWRQT